MVDTDCSATTAGRKCSTMRKEQRKEAERIFCRFLCPNGVVKRQVEDEWLTPATHEWFKALLLLGSPAQTRTIKVLLLPTRHCKAARLFHDTFSYDVRLPLSSPSKFEERLRSCLNLHLTKSCTFKHPPITFPQNRFDLSVPPVLPSYPHLAKSTDISIMPPKGVPRE
jgi:hypothetical protein